LRDPAAAVLHFVLNALIVDVDGLCRFPVAGRGPLSRVERFGRLRRSRHGVALATGFAGKRRSQRPGHRDRRSLLSKAATSIEAVKSSAQAERSRRDMSVIGATRASAFSVLRRSASSLQVRS
jgi:hypothetical protein